MKLTTVTLKENQRVPVGIAGDYFRVIESPVELTVEFPELGIESQFLEGLSVKLTNRFKTCYVTAPADCKVRVMIGDGFVDDSRMKVQGTMPVMNKGGSSYDGVQVPLTAGVVAMPVDENVDRVLGTFTADVAGRLWHDNTVGAAKGIPYLAGALVEVKNTAELYFWPESDGTAHFLEDIS